MKIKIESDVFDIVDRIKELDDGYFILFDNIKMKYEIHNSKQSRTYCFTSKQDNLNSCVIDEILYSFIGNIDKIIEEIDNNNDLVEKNNLNNIKDESTYKFREMYDFFNNSSKEYDSNIAFSTTWR